MLVDSGDSEVAWARSLKAKQGKGYMRGKKDRTRCISVIREVCMKNSWNQRKQEVAPNKGVFLNLILKNKQPPPKNGAGEFQVTKLACKKEMKL